MKFELMIKQKHTNPDKKLSKVTKFAEIFNLLSNF